MRKIYSMLLAIAAVAITFMSCSTNDSFYFTASEDDSPRILNTDIPESSGGEPCTLPSITRDNNFKFTVIVTPAEYTTVTWFIDGAEVYEGTSIDYQLIAGTYSVKILATTTKGKETYRNCVLQVLPCDGDPTIADDAKNLWCQIGAKKTLNVSNFTGIASMTIGGVAITDFVNNGSTVTFTVPELTVGDQKVVVTDAEGYQYGCGNVNITTEKWVDPGVETVTLWSGDNALNWDAENVKITKEQLADVPAGTKLNIEYELIPEDELAEKYYALRITTPWWGDNPEDNLLPQTDMAGTESPYVLDYSEHCKALVDERGAMCLVGNGLKIKSISYEKQGVSEKTLWEGNTTINWGDSNVKISAADLADAKVGSTVSLYYESVTADYHAMRVTTPSWGDNPEDNLVQQFDITGDTPNPYTFEYTEACKNLVDNRDGMLIVGYGYALKKVTIK